MPNGLVGFLSDNWRIPAYMFANQETNSHLLYYPLQRSTSKTDLKPVLVKKKDNNNNNNNNSNNTNN